MTEANAVLQRFLERLCHEQGCSAEAAASSLLEHQWRESQYRHETYPKIAKAILTEPWDVATLRQLLVKSKESPTGGHASTRSHVDAFLSLDQGESLVRTLIGKAPLPPNSSAINEFVRSASELAFFTEGKTRKNRQHAESALFASVLLTAVFPDEFVDYRQDRWNWAVDAFGLSSLPPPGKMIYGQNIVHAGKIAQEFASTEIFQNYFASNRDLWTVAGLVFLLCKDQHFRELVEMPPDAPPSPTISPAIRKAFESFRNDSANKFIVELRRHRARALRDLLSTPDEIDLKTFNEEVWVYCSRAHIGEVNVTKTLHFTKPLSKAELDQLSSALTSDQLELHGNCMWGSGARIYGTKMEGGDDTRLQNIKQALSLLNFLMTKS